VAQHGVKIIKKDQKCLFLITVASFSNRFSPNFVTTLEPAYNKFEGTHCILPLKPYVVIAQQSMEYQFQVKTNNENGLNDIKTGMFVHLVQ
jgi:hypothetical protein